MVQLLYLLYHRKDIVDLLLIKWIDKANNNGFTPLKGASVASFMGHLDVATEAQF